MRVKYGKARRKSKKRIFREAKGRRGGRRNLLRTVKETIVRSRAFAFRDRRVRKRDFRRLWITRLSAACRELGLSYSQFIFGLKKAEIELNRKSLSELAIHEPDVFAEVVAVVKETLGN
ncbi:MAG: 50S ribosomal protein L20 [Planctomycetes bacterium]|nr:50S ribosomal protein L20 [Planctomycetota bacterium]